MDHKQGPPLVTIALGLLGLFPPGWLDLFTRVVMLALALLGGYISLSRYLWDLKDRGRRP